MISLNTLSSIQTRRKKRLGRGYGSGKGGHTVGRGQKGQKSRRTIPLWFEGGQLPLIRRTPFIRGKSRFDPTSVKPYTITLNHLDKFKKDTVVDLETAQKMFKITGPVKVLGTGKLSQALTVKLPVSASAKKAIEAAGGTVI